MDPWAYFMIGVCVSKWGAGNSTVLDLHDDTASRTVVDCLSAFSKSIGFCVYIDPTRKIAAEILLQNFERMIAGAIRHSTACFLWYGLRGVGKSCFMRAMAGVCCRVASSNTLVIYVNWKSTAITRPAQMIAQALRTVGVDVEDEASLTDVYDALSACDRNAILFVDGLEALYLVNDDFRLSVLQDLHLIGDFAGVTGSSRRIMAVLTGSEAVLRTLVFRPLGFDEASINRHYPLTASSISLNKYIPLALCLLYKSADVAAAAMAYAESDEVFLEKALQARLIIPSNTSSSAAGTTECEPITSEIESTYAINKDMVQRFSQLSRGCFILFSKAVEQMACYNSKKDCAELYPETDLQQVLKHAFVCGKITPCKLFEAMKCSIKIPATETAQSTYYNEAIIAEHKVSLHKIHDILKTVPLPVLEGALLEAADERLLWYDDSEKYAAFLHPGDLIAWMALSLKK